MTEFKLNKTATFHIAERSMLEAAGVTLEEQDRLVEIPASFYHHQMNLSAGKLLNTSIFNAFPALNLNVRMHRANYTNELYFVATKEFVGDKLQPVFYAHVDSESALKILNQCLIATNHRCLSDYGYKIAA